MLTFSDVASGKMEQSTLEEKENTDDIHIEEVRDGHDRDTDEGTTTDYGSTAFGFREFFKSGEDTNTAETHVLSLPEGEEDVSVTSEAVPCNHSRETTCDDTSGEKGLRKDTLDCQPIEE